MSGFQTWFSKFPKFTWVLLGIFMFALIDPVYVVERYAVDRQFYNWTEQEALEEGRIKDGYRQIGSRDCLGSPRYYPAPVFFVKGESFCMSQHSYCPVPGSSGTGKYNDTKRIGMRMYKCGCPSDSSATNQTECHSQNLETHNYAEWRLVGYFFDFSSAF